MSEHSLVASARGLAPTLASDANAVDRDGVTRSRIDLLAHEGLLAPWAPEELGGGGAPAAASREITELIAGACGTTWFVVTQHRTPLESALGTSTLELHDRWARRLASGDALGAVAFAHLRRSGPAQVVAEPFGDGWRISGHLDWVTGWGLADVLCLMAATPDGDVVETLIPARARPGMTVGRPLTLAAMGGTRTVPVELDRMVVTADEVARVVPLERWRAQDADRTVNASPAVFGILRAVLTALHAAGERASDRVVTGAARAMAVRADELRTAAYSLIDDVAPAEEHAQRLEVRARSLLLLHEATGALVAALGGRAMGLDQDAQRWAREALFLLVQAQTADLRHALLRG